MTSNQNIHLSLNDDYTSQILSTFLWREPSPPDASKIIDSKYTELGAGKTVEFSGQEYMDVIGNKFIKANPFGVFKKFFGSQHENGSGVVFDTAGVEANANGEYELTHEQVTLQL